MAVRTAYAPVAGTVITAANHAKFPGGWIGYVEVTASQTGITTEVDVTSLTLTPTVGTSRRIRTSMQVTATVTNIDTIAWVKITDGSNNQKGISQLSGPLANVGNTMQAAVSESGITGSITRKLRCVRAAGTGTIDINAASDNPAWLMIEDLGPSS